jgi:glycerol dehydrogenase-like iron-containing ADH family enzyme
MADVQELKIQISKLQESLKGGGSDFFKHYKSEAKARTQKHIEKLQSQVDEIVSIGNGDGSGRQQPNAGGQSSSGTYTAKTNPSI